jgi:uncharacterized protein (TIGR02246 family)
VSSRLYTFAAAVFAAVLLSLQPAHAQTTVTSMSDDEKALRQIVQQVEDAWNAHDGKAFAAPFAAEADYVVVNGVYVKGREEIERGHTGIFTTIYKESRNAATLKSIRFLRPDVAVVHVEWNMEVRPGAERARAMSSMVMTKEGGKWSIAVFQNTPVQPPRH